MTTEALQYINSCMKELIIPYEFMEWASDLSFPYVVGEYSEIEAQDEDGLSPTSFILTATTNTTFLELETIKQKIKNYFTDVGRTAILESKSGMAISYVNSFPVPTGETGLKRLQINLNIKEWRV